MTDGVVISPMARPPLMPFAYLALAMVSLAGPVAFMLANPSSPFAFILVLPGAALAFVFLFVFSHTFYFEGGSKPSFFERVRVRKCPYCGAWAVHAVEMELQDVETESSAAVEGTWPTADGVFGTRSLGMDRSAAPATVAVTTLKFQENLRCDRCGKTWTRTVKHEETPDEAFGKYSGELREQGYED
jgi:ribosomal protein L44E